MESTLNIVNLTAALQVISIRDVNSKLHRPPHKNRRHVNALRPRFSGLNWQSLRAVLEGSP